MIFLPEGIRAARTKRAQHEQARIGSGLWEELAPSSGCLKGVVSERTGAPFVWEELRAICLSGAAACGRAGSESLLRNWYLCLHFVYLCVLVLVGLTTRHVGLTTINPLVKSSIRPARQTPTKAPHKRAPTARFALYGTASRLDKT